MEWTLFVFAVTVVFVVVGGSALARRGRRRGKRGWGWSALMVFEGLRLLLDALPTERGVEWSSSDRQDAPRTKRPRR